MAVKSKILVFAEQNNQIIHSVSYELLGKAIELATSNEAEVCAVILGDGIDVAELCYRGADKVYYIKDIRFNTLEEYLYKENLIPFIRSLKPDLVLFGATNFGRSLAPRIAGALNTGLTADCTDLRYDNNDLIQIRPAFSNNIMAHIKTTTTPKMATIRYKEFPTPLRNVNNIVEIEVVEPYCVEYTKSKVLKSFSETDFNISDADIVVSAGRGVKKAEDLRLIEELADVLSGTLGASRALVDTGMIGSMHQVGYSGHRVKPRIYIACGISGAPQHIAGMKESDFIIAINSDASAPIFNIADIGYIGDMFQIIPEMIAIFKKSTGGCNE
ncbi:MAG: electron transfer flavoprotein subunit alpha/FixB family protein [Dethiosulfatibacter sp.]|nr:electron transfer flavoprotein subunit alpha/FixB family protein [Dethiosulfatibacter sp.]